jgi:hypothetical protein
MMNLHTDSYYRGYRLAHRPSGEVRVYYNEKFVERTDSIQEAKDDIDAWHDAN